MARKKLLTESEIRRFMKLATLGPVGDHTIKKYGLTEADEELDIQAELGDEPEGETLDVSAEDMPPVEDVEGLGDEGPEAAPVDEETATELAKGFADVIEDVLGVTVQVDGEEPGAPEEEEEVSLETDVDLEGPMGGVEAEEFSVEEEEPAMRDMYESQQELINTVAQRVAARLIKESRKTQMVDDLTERIFDRLTTK